MSCYVELDMTCTLFREIVDYLYVLLPKLDNAYTIEDLVHTIDALEDLKEEYNAKQNKEFQKEREFDKLFFNQDGIEDQLFFREIEWKLNKLDLDPKEKFYTTMELYNLFEEKMKKEESDG